MFVGLQYIKPILILNRAGLPVPLLSFPCFIEAFLFLSGNLGSSRLLPDHRKLLLGNPKVGPDNPSSHLYIERTPLLIKYNVKIQRFHVKQVPSTVLKPLFLPKREQSTSSSSECPTAPEGISPIYRRSKAFPPHPS